MKLSIASAAERRAPRTEVLGRRHHHWTTPKDFSSLQAPILLATDRKAHRRRHRQDFVWPAPRWNAAAFFPRARRIPRHRRHACRDQPGFIAHEVQRTRLKLLHAELVSDEHGRNLKAGDRHYLRRNQQTLLPPDSLRASSEGIVSRLHYQSRPALRPNHPTSSNPAPSPPCATACCRSFCQDK